MRTKEKKRKIGSILCLCLMFICAFSAQALAADTQPKISVIAVGTDNGEYLEVGLSLKDNGHLLQSMGIALSYDNSLLTPVGWGDNTISQHAALDWESAVILPTKGPDELSGKVGLNYKDGSTSYMYLSAESARTVRINHHTSLPETTTAIDARWHYADTMNTPIYQALTVRFRLEAAKDNELDEDELKAAQLAAVQSLLILQDEAALLSPIGNEQGVAWLSNSSPAGQNIAADIDYLLVGTGQSVSTGGSGGGGVDLADIGTILFYDWDDTFLGAVAVDRYAGEAELKQVMRDFALKRMAPQDKVNQYGYYSEMEDGQDLGAQYPLTYKKAYTFEHEWLDQNSNAFECYLVTPPPQDPDDTRTYQEYLAAYHSGYYNIVPKDHGILADYTAAELPKYSALAQDGYIAVKAAYKAAADINQGGTGEAFSRYKQTYIEYDRYGGATATGGTYSLQMRYVRENVDGYGVSRLREPALRATLKPAADTTVSLYTLTTLSRSDIIEAEVVVHKQIAEVICSVIDAYSGASWPSLGAFSPDYSYINYLNAPGDEGLVKQASFAYINKHGLLQIAGSPESEWTQVTFNTLIDAGFNYKGAKITLVNGRNLPAKILTAIGQHGALTHEQMQNVIDDKPII